MSLGEKLHIHRWAMKYQPNVQMAITAHQIAAMAGDAYQVTAWLREGKLNRYLPPRPDPRQWLGLYRKHNQVRAVVADTFSNPWGNGQRVGNLLAGARQIQRWARHHREEFKKSIQNIGRSRLQLLFFRADRRARKRYKSHLMTMVEYFDCQEKEQADDFGQMMADNPEIQFVVTVLLPCYVYHECSPILLLRRARQGNVDAIEALVRLDPIIVSDRKIAAWINGGSGDIRHARIEMISQWQKEGAGGRFEARAVKESFAAFLSTMSDVLGRRWRRGQLVSTLLTARQILELFHDVARDRKTAKGALQSDPDLEDLNLESWVKAIQRRRKSWIDGVFGGWTKVDGGTVHT